MSLSITLVTERNRSIPSDIVENMPSNARPSAKLALPTLALCCVMISLAVETEAQLNFSTGWGKRSGGGGGDDSIAVGPSYASGADSFMDEKFQKQQQQQQRQSSDLDEFVRFYRRFRKARDRYQLQDPDA
uniref:Uncharacterized protein n=1 Tax=Trichogramma kaykai TaxID=54128 RepID=A0ABD2XEL8_9HYME